MDKAWQYYFGSPLLTNSNASNKSHTEPTTSIPAGSCATLPALVSIRRSSQHSLVGWLLAAFLSIPAAPSLSDSEFSKPHQLSEDHATREVFEGIRLLGALTLSRQPVAGVSTRELSALAWDTDEGLLYAVSDNGDLIHLRPRFAKGVLIAAEAVAATLLKDSSGAPLESSAADAEGLAILNSSNGIHGDTLLAISFEQPPRLIIYRPTGEIDRPVALPPLLANTDSYAGANRQLEAVARHPELGYLVGPERPLRSADLNRLAIYDMNGNAYQFPPLDRQYSALVGLEVTPDGDILVLERLYQSLLRPIVFAVRSIARDQLRSPGKVTVTDVVKFNSRDDWAMDNFEGLAHHEGNRYFMISDDGRNPLQRTILMYFEIPPPAAPVP